jgi:hypothetical protein
VSGGDEAVQGVTQMDMQFDRGKTLQELENCDWGEPHYLSSLVVTCHKLRRTPLNQFTSADLRVMIGQKISLEFLIPIALEQLEANPFVQAYFYRGDLLAAVLQVEKSYWTANPASFKRTCEIVRQVKSLIPTLDEVDGPTVRDVLKDASSAFLQI